MLRLPVGASSGRTKPGGPERAIANWDEDAVTMAVAAAVDCLRGRDRAAVDAVLFASTSYAFKEKQGAAIIAKALDLRRDVQTTDIGDSLRAGTNALRLGADAVTAGSAKRVLVVTSDTRMAAPRSAMEGAIGDAAAAFLLGDDEVAVELTARHAVSDEIIDVWRTEGDPFVHGWEDRFVVEHHHHLAVAHGIDDVLDPVQTAPTPLIRLCFRHHVRTGGRGASHC
jgi:3-hydroxy-3-methylglutaryl CoA synthase